MWQWLKVKRSKLLIKAIFSFTLAISTAIFVAIPAQADIVPDKPQTPICIEVINLEKYPDYQLFVRTRLRQRRPIENEYIKDVALKPGMCSSVSSGPREEIDFYATLKTNLNQIDLIPDSKTAQIKGLKSLQAKLILGKFIYTPINSSEPFFTGSIQRKVQITNLDGDTFKFKTQQLVYVPNYSWIFVLAIGLLLTVVAIGLQLRGKASTKQDLL